MSITLMMGILEESGLSLQDALSITDGVSMPSGEEECDVCNLWKMPHPSGCMRPKAAGIVVFRPLHIAGTV